MHEQPAGASHQLPRQGLLLHCHHRPPLRPLRPPLAQSELAAEQGSQPGCAAAETQCAQLAGGRPPGQVWQQAGLHQQPATALLRLLCLLPLLPLMGKLAPVCLQWLQWLLCLLPLLLAGDGLLATAPM